MIVAVLDTNLIVSATLIRGGNEDRIAYWQGKADRLLMQMKSDDQEHPDRDLGFSTARDRVGAYDLTHPYAALLALDGW